MRPRWQVVIDGPDEAVAFASASPYAALEALNDLRAKHGNRYRIIDRENPEKGDQQEYAEALIGPASEETRRYDAHEAARLLREAATEALSEIVERGTKIGGWIENGTYAEHYRDGNIPSVFDAVDAYATARHAREIAWEEYMTGRVRR